MDSRRLQKRAEAATWLLDRWRECFALAIESMTGEAPELQAVEGTASEPEEPLVWSHQLSLGSEYVLTASFAKSSWQAISLTALGNLGIANPEPESLKGTFLEILNQTFSAVASRIGERIRSEVSCGPGRAENAQGVVLSEVTGDLRGTAVVHGFGATDAVISALSAETQFDRGADREAQEPSRTLDLLLDVELPVSVSFGRTQMPLKEVLKLTSGSIVELNRTVSEPVEVIVNNCVIARGAVVMVDGNYGIRIQEIVSRQERLRTLN